MDINFRIGLFLAGLIGGYFARLLLERRKRRESHADVVRIGQTKGIIALAPPKRNPENTPGASSRPSPAAAARSQAWHGLARSGQAAQDG